MRHSSSLMDDEEGSLPLVRYAPSQRAREVLVQGGIIAQDETPQEMLERVVSTLFSIEERFSTPPAKRECLATALAEQIAAGDVILGTPTLTNAGRHEMALSSCVVIPVDLQKPGAEQAECIRAYYRQNMGSGFQFTDYRDPVAVLCWLNDLSAHETASGIYERYIGNMGLLHVSHPRIREFIAAKRERQISFFNISVDVSEDFMRRAEAGESFALADGSEVSAAELLRLMAENAWYNGDPGLLFLERLNHDNPLEGMSSYASTPPCAEMGLAVGETSQFGYINLQRFVSKTATGAEIAYGRLERTVRLLTRALDNAIEYSLPRYPTPLSTSTARLKRKMGIGVCGLADMLIALRLPYESQEARDTARDVISFITYISKCASVELAQERGSCLAMNFPLVNKYINDRYLEKKYMQHATRSVSAADWQRLAETIRTTRLLRNISTTALAPTGRSSVLLGVTASIEPLFSVSAPEGGCHQSIVNLLKEELAGDEQALHNVLQEAERAGSCQQITALSPELRRCLKTAKEIDAQAHLQMTADLAGLHGVVDESASKTINLPHEATVEEVEEIFFAAFHMGLKNISVYRDRTLAGQPMLI